MSFPNPCNYCQEIHGVKSCLLPYQIVQWMKANSYVLDSSMRLAKVHADFGDHNLRAARHTATYLELQGAETFDSQLKAEGEMYSQTGSSTSYSYQFSRQPEEITESQTVTHDATENKQGESQTSTEVKPLTKKSIEKLNAQTQSSEKNHSNESELTISTSTKHESTPHKGVKLDLNEIKTPEARNKPVNELSDAEITITAKDVCGSLLVIKASAHAKAKQVTVSEFFEIILSETHKLRRFGKSYKAAPQDAITHPTGLAKYLFMYHISDTFYEWESDLPCTQHDFCILSFKRLQLQLETEDPLNEVLNDYVQAVFRQFRDYAHQFTRLKELINLEAQVMNVNNILTWFNSYSRERKALQKRSDTMKLSVNKLVPEGTTVSPTVKKANADHSCPSINDIDQRVINELITVAINNHIQEKGHMSQALEKDDILVSRFKLILKEIIHHNGSWDKLTQGLNIKSFERYLSYANIQLDRQKLAPTLSVINELLNRLKTLKSTIS